MTKWIEATTPTGQFALDPAIGNIRNLVFQSGGRALEPLHSAPWIDEQDLPDNLAPVERFLSGDFFCTPFGAGDVLPGPIHGWTANSPWKIRGREQGGASLELARPVFGATVTKKIWLSQDAPLLYQQHTFSGGEGGITIAHHPMVKLSGRGWLCVSPKQVAIAADKPLEPGRNRLAAGGRSTFLTRFPASDNGTVDLTDLPIGTRHEDFVTLVEEAGRAIGWTAIIREAEDDIVFFIKDPAVLPVTMLWHSNGGRDYPPWNGRHRGVIGIEDGCAAGELGHSAALKPNTYTKTGIPTALALGDDHTIGHVTGAIARPPNCNEISDITIEGKELTVRSRNGPIAVLPFEPGVFA